MDVTSLASVATDMATTRTNAAVSTAVLKKAIDIQAQSVLDLLDALPQPSNLPSHLGQNVNTQA